MKNLLLLLFFAFSSISAFSQEKHVVTAPRIVKPGPGSHKPDLRPTLDVGGSAGQVDGAGGIKFDGTGNYRGCQECQSPTAFYSCTVRVLAPVDTTHDEIFNQLSKENCCRNKGGVVLKTVTGGC